MDCELRGLVQSSNEVELCWTAAACRTRRRALYSSPHSLGRTTVQQSLQQEKERLETSKAQTLSRAAAGIRERHG